MKKAKYLQKRQYEICSIIGGFWFPTFTFWTPSYKFDAGSLEPRECVTFTEATFQLKHTNIQPILKIQGQVYAFGSKFSCC